MKIFKTNIILTAFVAATTMMSSSVFADDSNKMQEAYKSTNVKAALINVCKDDTAKGNKLTAAEATKYCNCAIDADAKLTNAQKWEIQSTINQKKSPSTLAFVKKQHVDLQACFGPQLTAKLEKLTQEAMKAQAAAK